jgi:hypothetical protein
MSAGNTNIMADFNVMLMARNPRSTNSGRKSPTKNVKITRIRRINGIFFNMV